MVTVSGDAQAGAPKAALPVKPVVAVKDAAGAGLPGVTVTFSVDSGNGSLAATTMVTANDGTASPGDWILGTAEGRNVITAHAGTLPALKLVATATLPTVNLAGQTVPTTGGTVTLTLPGSALDGTTLTIPPGALGSAGTIGFSISSASTLVLPAGVTAVSPTLAVTGPVGRFKVPATLRLPGIAPAGKVLVVVLMDPATGAMSVLPSSASGASGITVALPSIDAPTPAATVADGNTPLVGARTSATTSLHAPVTSILVTIAIDPTLLARDFDSGFRTAADEWDFQRQLISSFPVSLSGPGVDPDVSMIGTSIWYFVNRKGTDGPLFQKYQEAPGIPESNRRGFRWTSVAYSDVPDLYLTGGLADATFAQIKASSAAFALQSMNEIKAAFLLSSNKPQPVMLFNDRAVATGGEPRFGIAYRTVGAVVELSIPDAPGRRFTMELLPTGWVTAFVTPASGIQYRVDHLAPVHYGLLVQDAAFAQEYARVTAKTIGDAQGWPRPTLNSAYGLLDTAAVYAADTLRNWWVCSACEDHGFRTTQITPSPTLLAAFRRADQNANGSWGALAPAIAVQLLHRGDLPLPNGQQKRGYEILQPMPGSGLNTLPFTGWLDWITVNYKQLPTDVRPDSIIIIDDQNAAYTATVTGGPSGSTYRWKYVGDKVTDSTDTNTPAFSRFMTDAVGRSMMYGTVLEKTTKRPLGRDSSAVLYAKAWQFKAVSLASALLPPGGTGTEPSDVLGLGIATSTINDLQQRPSNSILDMLHGPNNCRAIALQQYLPGQVPDTGGVKGNSFRALLGNNCPDPDFIQTLTIAPLGAGTIVGSVAPSFADPDVVTIPGGTITATMNGLNLQGTFVWKFRYSTGIALYTFNFQASLLIPK
ncbi:MAG: hypothetical protein IPP90_15065 [Gemmatimonadaceae bacterium]|nr:hypothetical protein [Gemmatimonadaceae bacterium]